MQTKVLRFFLLGIVIAAISLAALYRDAFDTAALQGWVNEAGPAAPLLFMLIYAIGAVLFLPGSALTLAGGALFGPVWGSFYNLTGATIGATLAFLAARYLASDWVERKTGGRMKQLKEGVEAEGWHFVAFVRLVPLFPFNVLNYALGLTRIKLWHYVVASYLCMLPGAVAYTYLGYAGKEAIAGGEGLIQKGLLALALLVTVAFLPRLIKRLRSAPLMSAQTLKQYLDDNRPMTVLDVRNPAEFTGEQGHIARARNIPVEDLAHRISELTEWRECPVAIVCRTDKRSFKAAQLLAQKGFADVRVVKGGMTEWNRLDYPVEH